MGDRAVTVRERDPVLQLTGMGIKQFRYLFRTGFNLRRRFSSCSLVHSENFSFTFVWKSPTGGNQNFKYFWLAASSPERQPVPWPAISRS